MSQKTKVKEEFSFERKKKMAAKISTMTNTDQLRKIRDIIFSENQNVSARKNNEGYLMYFQNYTNETYYKIEKYLNRVEKEKLEKQTRALTETSDHILSSEDPQFKDGHSQVTFSQGDTDYTLSRSRLRYSNTERRLMKRRDYEKKISEGVNTQDPEDIDEDQANQYSETHEDKKNQCSDSSESSDRPIKIKKTIRTQTQQKGNKLFPELPTIDEKNEKCKPIFSLSSSTKTKKN